MLDLKRKVEKVKNERTLKLLMLSQFPLAIKFCLSESSMRFVVFKTRREATE